MDTARPLFDRRAPPELIDALRPDGPLGNLVSFAREDSRAGLDLQLRGNPKRAGEGTVTLYVGLTQAFYLDGRSNGDVRVRPQTRFGPSEMATEQGWTRWQPADQLRRADFIAWVRQMVDDAYDKAGSKTDNEGQVQATVSGGVDEWFCCIDRESMFAFRTDNVRVRELERIRAPLQGAVERIRASAPWARAGGKPARKLDALGVDVHGNILVIEVKPGTETGALGWTPFQVATYTALFRAWASAEPDVRQILNGMVRQREALGLLETNRWEVRAKPRFLPVIAVGMPVRSSEVDSRMELVHEAISSIDDGLLADLEIWGVPEFGQIERVPLGSLHSWTAVGASPHRR